MIVVDLLWAVLSATPLSPVTVAVVCPWAIQTQY